MVTINEYLRELIISHAEKFNVIDPRVNHFEQCHPNEPIFIFSLDNGLKGFAFSFNEEDDFSKSQFLDLVDFKSYDELVWKGAFYPIAAIVAAPYERSEIVEPFQLKTKLEQDFAFIPYNGFFRRFTNSFFITDGILHLIHKTKCAWLINKLISIAYTKGQLISEKHLRIEFLINSDRRASLTFYDTKDLPLRMIFFENVEMGLSVLKMRIYNKVLYLESEFQSICERDND